MNTPRFVILGPQGAGKGTQAGFISRRFHIPHISTGDVLRAEMAAGSALGKKITKTMNRGELISFNDTNAVMKRRLAHPDASHGWIVDGYPRAMGQARPFAKFGKPNLVIHLHLTDAAAIRRLAGRRVCPHGHIYHLKHDPPKKKRGYCDRDGLKLKQRADDTPAAIRRRLRIYHRETEPVLHWYRERVLVVTVDAHRPIRQVYAAVLKKLKQISWLSSRLQKK